MAGLDILTYLISIWKAFDIIAMVVGFPYQNYETMRKEICAVYLNAC